MINQTLIGFLLQPQSQMENFEATLEQLLLAERIFLPEAHFFNRETSKEKLHHEYDTLETGNGNAAKMCQSCSPKIS